MKNNFGGGGGGSGGVSRNFGKQEDDNVGV